jgi:hypothetical protein
MKTTRSTRRSSKSPKSSLLAQRGGRVLNLGNISNFPRRMARCSCCTSSTLSNRVRVSKRLAAPMPTVADHDVTIVLSCHSDERPASVPAEIESVDRVELRANAPGRQSGPSYVQNGAQGHVAPSLPPIDVFGAGEASDGLCLWRPCVACRRACSPRAHFIQLSKCVAPVRLPAITPSFVVFRSFA